MKKRIITALACLILLLSCTVLTSCKINLPTLPEAEPMPEKDALYAVLDAEPAEASYKYVYQYLSAWGFSNYSAYKLLLVENQFIAYYVEDLPEAYEHATTAAYDFLDNYYDELDLTDSSAVTTAIIDCYVKAIGDDYAAYRSPEEYQEYSQDMSGEFCGIGVTVEYSFINETMVITSVMRESPAEEAGFLPGDYIVAVGGKTLEELGYEGAVNAIKGEEGTTVSVKVLRGTDELTLTATRRKMTENTVYYEMLEGNIGYVQITSFKKNTDEQFSAAIDALEADGAVGLIFDLRNNGGGYLDSAVNMVDRLVPAGNVVTTYTVAGTKYTEKTKSDDKIDIPCVVLCNGYSASAAELFTSAIRDYGQMGLLNEAIVGTQSFGKGIMQSTWEFNDKSSITMTIAYYYTPLGENYHGVGITPDVVVENTEDTDLQFNAALMEIMAKTS